MRKALRYLRIAFSATCGILCLLLIALWVRSYWYWDQLDIRGSKRVGRVFIETANGALIVFHTPGIPGSNWTWHKSRALRVGGPGGVTNDWNRYERDRELGGFGYVARRPWHTIYRAPLWFFAALSVALATLPWFRWRFSLRTLLIAMTLVDVLLGVLVLIN